MRQAGTWDSAAGLCLDTPLHEPQNTGKLYGTKIIVCITVGANYGQKIQRDQKTQLPFLKSCQSRVLSVPLCGSTTEGVGKPAQPSCGPSPPQKKPARPFLGSEQEGLLLALAPPAAVGAPLEPSLHFSSGL